MWLRCCRHLREDKLTNNEFVRIYEVRKKIMSEHKKKKVFVIGAITPQFIADSIAKHSTKTNIGAHDIFLGQVRADVINGKTVQAIDYSAYEEMAEDKFHEIREAAFTKFDLA